MRLRKKILIGLMPFKVFCVIGLQIEKKPTKMGMGTHRMIKTSKTGRSQIL